MTLPIGRTEKVDIGGRRLNVWLAGDSGPTVVLVHGIPTNHRLWWDVVPALARHARVVAVDQLGYGDSDHPDGWETDIASQAAYVVRLLDALGRDRVVVIRPRPRRWHRADPRDDEQRARPRAGRRRRRLLRRVARAGGQGHEAGVAARPAPPGLGGRSGPRAGPAPPLRARGTRRGVHRAVRGAVATAGQRSPPRAAPAHPRLRLHAGRRPVPATAGDPHGGRVGTKGPPDEAEVRAAARADRAGSPSHLGGGREPLRPRRPARRGGAGRRGAHQPSRRAHHAGSLGDGLELRVLRGA
ncbi:alpha/beta fold hydrolase [Sanguibacter sp. YZGR15]|uniref:Alpha/beta fold hydrolase n=1 Tax=Sanguibacter suaedae TaxID=2795737 RepID=A0A934IAW7_9MICO|nr:alpha/beta fold hydrolase [Sanguibacter suaedae]